jgi:uncharacterized protein (DUF983 family)
MAAFLAGAIGKCPKCGDHQLTRPAKPGLDVKVTCLTCGHVATVEQAIDAGRAKPQAGGS